MTATYQTIQRSTVALLGAVVATVMLIVASAPHVPLA